MSDTEDHALRQKQARRLSTDGTSDPIDETVRVPFETSVTIDVELVDAFTLLCTPNDKLALVYGFLLSEGIVDNMADIEAVRECDDDSSVMRVSLSRPVPRHNDPGRNLLIVSSCGACGEEDLDKRIEALPKVGDTLRIDSSILKTTRDGLQENQPLFEACGATHAASLFDAEGKILACAEDTGRHHALDKAIGLCLLSDTAPAGAGTVLSGRVSLEMVGKCARAGIELISAVSGPTSLAIEVADKCGITLCAFVRESRATVFTHPHRVNG